MSTPIPILQTCIVLAEAAGEVLPAGPDAAPASEVLTPAALVAAGAMTGLSLLIALAAGVYRVGRVAGPLRILPGERAFPLTKATLLAVFCWFGAQLVYGVYLGATRGPDPATATADSARFDLQPKDLALLSTIPAALGIAAMLGSLASEVDGVPRMMRLGLSGAHLSRSFVPAVAGVLFAYPLVFWVLLAAQAVFSALGYEHPSEHELLREMGDATSPLLRAALVAGAVVAAPIFEELVFRGGVQTLLRRLFDPAGERAGPAWAAIGVSSLLFAMVHPLWMVPAIFTLSLSIGYVYERTGNLWAAILLHAAFNAVNTAVYLG